jgi:hypothetical protein
MRLIDRPGQCGARSNDSKPICTIDGSVFLKCPSTFTFPKYCPLLEGISVEEHNAILLQLGEDIAQTIFKSKDKKESFLLTDTDSKERIRFMERCSECGLQNTPTCDSCLNIPPPPNQSK